MTALWIAMVQVVFIQKHTCPTIKNLSVTSNLLPMDIPTQYTTSCVYRKRDRWQDGTKLVR
ncbi:hypothetical protein OH492_22565 [Vibrio chagasii]|nr:hypothetical protein [Vibrio chagasii]